MHVVLVYNGLCSARIFICAQNWEFADLLRFWGDKASCLQLKGAWFAIVPDPLDIDHYKDSYNSGGKKSRWDVEEDEAAGANDAMQEIDEGEEEEELEDDEEIPLENLPSEPVDRPSKAVNPSPPSKAMNPPSKAVNPPSKAVNPPSNAHSMVPFRDDSRRSMTSLASSASLAGTVIDTPERLVQPIIPKDGKLTPSPVSLVMKEVLLVVDSPVKVVKEEPRMSQEHAKDQAGAPQALFDREAALQELAMLEARMFRSLINSCSGF